MILYYSSNKKLFSTAPTSRQLGQSDCIRALLKWIIFWLFE